jgi:hypothetical protein
MKKNLLLLFIGLTCATLQAQESTVDDALRLAVEHLTGTARFRAMGGAFGALGGDMSAMNQNPAGSLFFNNNYATITGTMYNTYNSSNYWGSQSKHNDASLDINQAGAVFVFTDNSGATNWKKLAVALNYENTNNFNNSMTSAGINPYNSIGNYFMNQATSNGGIPQELLETLPNETFFDLYDYLGLLPNTNYPNINGFQAQEALLGYTAQIFHATSPNTYASNIPTGTSFFQNNYFTSTGYNGKVTGNFAAQYNNILYLGLNINAHFTDYLRTTSVHEENTSPASTTTKVHSILFDNELHTFGSGFSFNIGAIVKVIPELRLGLAYESPTWYNLTDELTQYLETTTLNNTGLHTNIANPEITNVYAPYSIQTPSKWTGSLAYIYEKKGLISIDVSSKDYSMTRFKPKSVEPYNYLNNYMNKYLDRALELRIGGEYKIKQISLRGGYHFDQSPYKIDQEFGDLTGYSAGVGYNFGDWKLDLAYSNEHRNINQTFLSSGMTDAARISRHNNYITLSYSMNF